MAKSTSKTAEDFANAGTNRSRGNPSVPMWPVDSQNIISGFGPRWGRMHEGVDIAIAVGEPIVATLGGTSQGPLSDSDGYGNYTVIDHPNGLSSLYAHMQSPTPFRAGDSVAQGEEVGRVGVTGNSQGPHLHFEIHESGTPVDPEPYLSGGRTFDGQGISGGASNLQTGNFSATDIFAIGRSAAFAAQVSLPGLLNAVDSIFLRGKKSIYNDEPLLPFIQQLCQGSLRHFQSLPDGSFYAFFPDYFGSYDHQKAYWEIRDVEIMDGGINLTDEPLATTVFTPGDTLNFSSAIEQPERLKSTGVITIFEMFASNSIASSAFSKENKEHQQGLADGEARRFLVKYGQRPYYEEAPFIRNRIFETFYAFTQFQLLWSRQFITEFSLTFMPELYPSGIVAFPDHGFQCYIDSVTHTFDYTSGFHTSANLVAPSAYGDKADENQGVSRGMVRGTNA